MERKPLVLDNRAQVKHLVGENGCSKSNVLGVWLLIKLLNADNHVLETSKPNWENTFLDYIIRVMARKFSKTFELTAQSHLYD